MSGYDGIDLEYLYYICCNNCSTVLEVNVPYTSLLNVVTVKCGQCNGPQCVNMKSMEPQPPLHLTLGQASSSCSNNSLLLNKNLSASCENINNEVVSYDIGSRKEESTYRAPRKRNRPPTAYNRFIKEEIQRIKTTNPDISHRKAFSTAAKNWALSPYMHNGLALDSNKEDQT